MSIVCAIDFSEPSRAAAAVASRLAAKLNVPLWLVHAIGAPEEASAGGTGAGVARVAARLEQEARALRPRGVPVECQVGHGAADEVTLRVARAQSARLIVLGAADAGDAERRLGRPADRVAERCHIPVLSLRGASALQSWLDGTRPLRIVLGVDASQSAEAAGSWVAELARLGECEVILAHLYWPPEELRRLGLGGVRDWEESDAEVERALRHEYAQRFAALFTSARVSYRLESHLGRTGDGLAQFAAEERADLVVVGCHDVGPLARLWHGSVAHRALHCAAMSVACVPAPEAGSGGTMSMRHALVATDFSKLGNAAVPLAYATVKYGGSVHLVHVLEAARDPAEPFDVFIPSSKVDPGLLAQKRAQLTELVPKDFNGAAAATRLHILQAPHAGEAICQAAERLGVDLICLGTHARSGLGRALLGSVAAFVLEHTRRPVLLTRGPQ
jgi:nucleotide-binding universal stress UspA family protein